MLIPRASLPHAEAVPPMKRQRVFALTLILIAFVLGSIVATATQPPAALTASSARSAAASASPPIAVAAPADPRKVLGNDSCVKCHAPEQAVWLKTPHARTFDELHRRPEARQIAAKLGLDSIKHSDRCIGCHYTTQVDPTAGLAAGSAGRTSGRPSADVHAIAGVSCESCHGAAQDWLDVHHDYGGPDVTRLTETPQHRQQRIARSIERGMRNPSNVYLVAQSCYRCHTTADEELVNVGGHSAGSLTFDFVAWSQGTVHHNFIASDGQTNQPSSPERLRVMFVAGVLAEVESTLRAVAIATTRDTYGLTAAKRASRSIARLKSLADKIPDPRLQRAVKISEIVSLKLNNEAQLTKAADMIAQIGIDLADQPPSSGMEQLDPFIPSRDQWK